MSNQPSPGTTYHPPRNYSTPALKPTASRKFCVECGTKFAFFRYSYNCYNCGEVVCGSCSESRVRIPRFGYENAVRVCKLCDELIRIQTKSEEQLSALPIKMLRKYIKQYNLPLEGLVEKNDLVRLILQSRPIPESSEIYFRSRRPVAAPYLPNDDTRQQTNVNDRRPSRSNSNGAMSQPSTSGQAPSRPQHHRRNSVDGEAAGFVADIGNFLNDPLGALRGDHHSQAQRPAPQPQQGHPYYPPRPNNPPFNPHIPPVGHQPQQYYAPPPNNPPFHSHTPPGGQQHHYYAPPPNNPPFRPHIPPVGHQPQQYYAPPSNNPMFQYHIPPAGHQPQHYYVPPNNNPQFQSHAPSVGQQPQHYYAPSPNNPPFQSHNLPQPPQPPPPQPQLFPSFHPPHPPRPPRPSPPSPSSLNDPPPSIKMLIDTNVDPTSISVKTLKAILKQNAVEHSHMVEKTELVKALQRLIDDKRAEMKIDIDKLPENQVCVICCDAVKNCVFIECGHLCSCMDCGRKLVEMRNECPICREPIIKLVHVFRT